VTQERSARDAHAISLNQNYSYAGVVGDSRRRRQRCRFRHRQNSWTGAVGLDRDWDRIRDARACLSRRCGTTSRQGNL